MKRVLWIMLSISSVFSLVMPYGLLSRGQAQTLSVDREETLQRLRDSLTGRGHVKRNRATTLADFVRLDRGIAGSLAPANSGRTRRERSLAFLTHNRQSFGLSNPLEELELANEKRDLQGDTHLTFNQIYKGIPVFAGGLKTHFNSSGELRAVNGEIVPDIRLNTMPSRSSDDAAAFALAKVRRDSPNAASLSIRGAKLYVYRTGLAQGGPGENHLVWEITVSNNADVTEFVYIDAHSGKLVNQLTGTYDVLDRRIYDGQNIPAFLPPAFPSNPFWVEGQPFPTGNTNGDEVIASSKETYDLFKNGFGRDSFDDLGSTMFSIFDSGYVAGNALAAPIFHLTLFSKELTADDIVGHEWTHVYTYYTDNLTYQWQPGALNEAYSDIFGETVDLLNRRGLDVPTGPRQADDCVRSRPTLHVNSPASVQGDYAMAPVLFGPPFSPSGITGNIVPVNDGKGVRGDACQTPFLNAAAVSENIALVDGSFEGRCLFSDRVKNAQLNGAKAVIITNEFSIGDDFVATIYGTDPTITIPSGGVRFSDGQALRFPGATTLNGTITGTIVTTSQRWHMGEETNYHGFRDLWNPRCYANAGKVSDSEYFCGTFDNGGVHQNSGIPNHAYALLVDGGTYNGQNIAPIGLTKAAHIYFRAMAFYQTATSDFADHAEALEASASDLLGTNLPDLITGLPSGESISLADLDQVHNATLAVELRTPPTQCGFPPLLAKNPPPDSCPAPLNTQIDIFTDDFESDPTSRWLISRDVEDFNTFISRDWLLVNQLPGGRTGSGFFGPDPNDCSSPAPGQAGVLHLDSPVINLPQVMFGGPHLSFEHYIAIETGYDGGQLLISVNDNPFRLVDTRAFIYNAYNLQLLHAPAFFGEEADNPRAGQPAFSGSDYGTFKGSWGKSIVDLTRYARAGDRIRLRWDLSTDICSETSLGWYLDNVRVCACAP